MLEGGDTIELVVCEHVDAPECRLWGISDVHLGSPDCDEDLFLSDIAAIKDDPLARVILNGDLLQYDTKKSKGDVYRQMYPPGQQKRIMRDYLMPIKRLPRRLIREWDFGFLLGRLFLGLFVEHIKHICLIKGHARRDTVL